MKTDARKTNVMTGSLIGTLIVILFTAIGCSKNGGGDPGAGTGVGVVNCTTPTCTTTSGISYIALSQKAQTELINYNNQYASYDTSYWFRRSSLIPANYTNLLRDAMGVCNREYYNGGDANCSTWGNAAHAMVLSAAAAGSTTANLNFWSTHYTNYNSYNYSYQFPQLKYLLFGLFGIPVPVNPQAYYNPMPLDTTLWAINQSQGFELRAYGPTDSKAQNQLFQLQVPVGKIGDQEFNYTLYLNSVKVSSGKMVLCQSQDCAGGW